MPNYVRNYFALIVSLLRVYVYTIAHALFTWEGGLFALEKREMREDGVPLHTDVGSVQDMKEGVSAKQTMQMIDSCFGLIGFVVG